MTRNNDYEYALSIDKKNGNNERSGDDKLEIDQKHDYDAYKDMGKVLSPKGHK